MDAPLAPFLARFAAVTDAATWPAEPERAAPARPAPPAAAEPLVSLTAAELEARLAAARNAAMAEAAAAHGAALAAAAQAHAAEATDALAAARRDWAVVEGRAAAAGLAAVADLRDLLADKAADVLRPLVARALVERTRAALAVALDQILDDPDQPCLTVSGPADLLEAIRAARGTAEGAGRAIAYTVADAPDVTVSARATRVETRLGAALAVLAATPDPEPQP